MGDYWKNVRGEMETSALNENPHDDRVSRHAGKHLVGAGMNALTIA